MWSVGKPVHRRSRNGDGVSLSGTELFMFEVGMRIRRLRVERNLSLVDVSKRSNLSPSKIWDIEGGLTRQFRFEAFAQLAKAFNVSMVDLLNVDAKDPVGSLIETMRTDSSALAWLMKRFPRQVTKASRSKRSRARQAA